MFVSGDPSALQADWQMPKCCLENLEHPPVPPHYIFTNASLNPLFACLSVTLVPASARGGPRVAVWARVSLRVRSEALSATFIARVNDYWGRPRDSDAATVHARWVYRRCSFLHRVRITLRSIKIFWQWSTRTRITLNWTINSVIALHCVSSAHATTVVWSYEYLFNYTIRVIFLITMFFWCPISRAICTIDYWPSQFTDMTTILVGFPGKVCC